eukprot:IDg3776t1
MSESTSARRNTHDPEPLHSGAASYEAPTAAQGTPCGTPVHFARVAYGRVGHYSGFSFVLLRSVIVRRITGSNYPPLERSNEWTKRMSDAGGALRALCEMGVCAVVVAELLMRIIDKTRAADMLTAVWLYPKGQADRSRNTVYAFNQFENEQRICLRYMGNIRNGKRDICLIVMRSLVADISREMGYQALND